MLLDFVAEGLKRLRGQRGVWGVGEVGGEAVQV